jgi:fibronectin type 3 domain-containing protein
MRRQYEMNSKTLKVFPFWALLVLLASILQPGCSRGAGTNASAPPPALSVPHSVQLSWHASTSTDVESYRVYRTSQSGGPYTPIGSVSHENRTFTDTNVQSGNTYFYVVKSVNQESVESTYSNEVRADIPHP